MVQYGNQYLDSGTLSESSILARNHNAIVDFKFSTSHFLFGWTKYKSNISERCRIRLASLMAYNEFLKNPESFMKVFDHDIDFYVVGWRHIQFAKKTKFTQASVSITVNVHNLICHAHHLIASQICNLFVFLFLQFGQNILNTPTIILHRGYSRWNGKRATSLDCFNMRGWFVYGWIPYQREPLYNLLLSWKNYHRQERKSLAYSII